MNADIPRNGLGPVLRSLNGDRGYGFALLAVCALLALPLPGGETVRDALSFDRAGIEAGQWWRLLSAHFVHLDGEHALLNGFGVVLMWALFARDYSPLRWAAIYLFSCLAISAGLWFLDPRIEWYVGASGALHGVMTAGTLAHLRRRDLDGWILAAFIVAKLCYEQFAGSMPFAGAANTIVDAHLYGAVGGLVLAFFLKARPADAGPSEN
jgi:rhomboid family GlyGly-CTERM serine protease